MAHDQNGVQCVQGVVYVQGLWRHWSENCIKHQDFADISNYQNLAVDRTIYIIYIYMLNNIHIHNNSTK
jgi:hypothetical protein